MKVDEIIEGEVIQFKKPEPKEKRLDDKEVTKLKSTVRKLTNGEGEGGRMGYLVRFADEQLEAGVFRNKYDKALKDLTKTFGSPKVDRTKNKLHDKLSKDRAERRGTKHMNVSNNTKYAWEIKDWVIILSEFNPDHAGTIIRIIKFK